MTEESAWRDRSFRLFAAGNAINNVGESMYALAIPLVAYDLTGSLVVMSVLASLYPLVITFGGPILGAAVDRFGPRRFVVPGLIVEVIAVFALAIVLLADTVEVWMLVVSEILVQSGAIAFRSGWMAGIPSMFPRHEARARGALLTVYQASVVVGPALAAVLIGPLGVSGLLWLNLATFVAPLIVAAIGVTPAEIETSSRSPDWGLADDLIDGWRVLREHRQAFALICVSIPFNFIMCNGTIALILYYLRDDLKVSAGDAGAIVAVANIGALLGSFSAAERPVRNIQHYVVGGLLICAGCLIVIPSFIPIWVIVMTLVVYFFVNSFVEVASEMVIFSSVPRSVMGRTTGFSRLVSGLAAFASPLLVAVVDPWFGARGGFVLLGIAALIPGLALMIRRVGALSESEQIP